MIAIPPLHRLTALAILIAPAPIGWADTTIAQPLVKIVSEVCQKDSPTAKDYARIAQSTVDFGRRMLQAKEHIQKEVITSGLDAVDIGEQLDAKGGNWSKLREELQSLLKDDHQQSPPTPQEKPPQNNQEQEKQGKENKSETDRDENPSSRNDQKSQGEQKNETDSSSQTKSENSPNDQPSTSNGSPSARDAKPSDNQNAQSAFGDMKDSHDPPTPPRQQSDPQETQKVGGLASKGAPQGRNEDPQLIIPLQKLDQLRNLDSPARLFRTMEGPPSPSTDKKGRDW